MLQFKVDFWNWQYIHFLYYVCLVASHFSSLILSPPPSFQCYTFNIEKLGGPGGEANY